MSLLVPRDCACAPVWMVLHLRFFVLLAGWRCVALAGPSSISRTRMDGAHTRFRFPWPTIMAASRCLLLINQAAGSGGRCCGYCSGSRHTAAPRITRGAAVPEAGPAIFDITIGHRAPGSGRAVVESGATCNLHTSKRQREDECGQPADPAKSTKQRNMQLDFCPMLIVIKTFRQHDNNTSLIHIHHPPHQPHE